MANDDEWAGDEPSNVSLLAEAAPLWGIETEYWDMFGKRHAASAPLIEGILQSLGVDCSSASAIEKALDARRREHREALLAPAVVVSASAPEVLLNVPDSLADAAVEITIAFEDGSQRSLTAPAGEPGNETPGGFNRLSLPLPNLPLGYHRIEARLGPLHASSFLIVTPDRAWEPEGAAVRARCGGIAVSLYSLRSSRNWGVGDFTDLESFLEWAARLGADFVSLNPLHAIANRVPYNTSPYLPNSIYYRNFLYLDVERLPEFSLSKWASSALASDAVRGEIAALRDAPNVEYERAARLKRRFLKLLFRSFLQHGGATDSAFLVYVTEQGEALRLFATYAALDEAIHRRYPDVWNWRSWPEPFRHAGSPAVDEFARTHWRAVMFEQWMQWRLDHQLASAQRRARDLGMSIGLYHDLALATDRFGADLWAHPRMFVEGCRVGAPPDDFSPLGQDWAFPPPNSEAHRHDGYRLFAESIRKNCRHGGALRIDHVMRFFRLYWIPEGMDAAQGTYVTDRHEDLVRVLALESVRNQVIIVGEDLGTVPDIARETLAKFGILSYRLFYFERDRAGRFREPHEYPADALVSVSTHDLPTLAGFWEGRDILARREAGILPGDEDFYRMIAERLVEKQKMLDLLHNLRLLPVAFPRDAAAVPAFAGELHSAIVGFLATTPCRLFLLNQEDLFKDGEQQNLPGTTAEYPNWRHKMKYAVEELETGVPAACAAMLRAWWERSGRLAGSAVES